MNDDVETPITTADAGTMADFGGQPETPAAETPAAETPPPSREELQAKDVEAFTKAVEEVSADEAPRGTKDPAPEASKPEAVAKPETPAQPAAEADPKAAAKAAVDAEVAKLNDDLKAGGHKPLTKAAEERFRELASRPKPEEVEKIVAPLKAQAERMERWDTIVEQTKATGQQLDTALQYIAAYNSGDPKLMGQAAELMFQEVAGMFKALGRELPGQVDPLQDHPDLAGAVEAGEMTRKYALETARARAVEARTSEQSQRQNEQLEFQRAETDARAKLNTLGQSLHTADPQQYLAKYPALIPGMKLIRERFHPSEWEARTFQLYQELPYTPPSIQQPPAQPQAPAKPKVGSVPIRPTGGNGAMRPQVPNDPVAAFKFGVENMR